MKYIHQSHSSPWDLLECEWDEALAGWLCVWQLAGHLGCNFQPKQETLCQPRHLNGSWNNHLKFSFEEWHTYPDRRVRPSAAMPADCLQRWERRRRDAGCLRWPWCGKRGDTPAANCRRELLKFVKARAVAGITQLCPATSWFPERGHRNSLSPCSRLWEGFLPQDNFPKESWSFFPTWVSAGAQLHVWSHQWGFRAVWWWELDLEYGLWLGGRPETWSGNWGGCQWVPEGWGKHGKKRTLFPELWEPPARSSTPSTKFEGCGEERTGPVWQGGASRGVAGGPVAVLARGPRENPVQSTRS